VVGFHVPERDERRVQVGQARRHVPAQAEKRSREAERRSAEIRAAREA
jgi:hypothetical protein